jgi:hypothetical protein
VKLTELQLRDGKVEASDIEDVSHSVDVMAADLAKLAEMCAEKGFRVVYENSCWATRTPTWKAAWEIVKKANQPNLGLALDTFQIAGGLVKAVRFTGGFFTRGGPRPFLLPFAWAGVSTYFSFNTLMIVVS